MYFFSLKETAELQKKQAWYQQNQVSMQKDDEEEYLTYCSEAMFRIHILELRLNRYIIKCCIQFKLSVLHTSSLIV